MEGEGEQQLPKPTENEESKENEISHDVDTKRQKIDEEGKELIIERTPEPKEQTEDQNEDSNDSGQLLGSKRIRSSELKYINLENIIQDPSENEEEQSEKDKIDQESLKLCAQKIGHFLKKSK